MVELIWVVDASPLVTCGPMVCRIVEIMIEVKPPVGFCEDVKVAEGSVLVKGSSVELEKSLSVAPAEDKVEIIAALLCSVGIVSCKVVGMLLTVVGVPLEMLLMDSELETGFEDVVINSALVED